MFSLLFVCLFVCFVFLSVNNFAQKLLNGFAWNFRGRLAMGSKQTIKFGRRSGSRIPIRIATLVRRALAEVRLSSASSLLWNHDVVYTTFIKSIVVLRWCKRVIILCGVRWDVTSERSTAVLQHQQLREFSHVAAADSQQDVIIVAAR